jgi:hypothetical protein
MAKDVGYTKLNANDITDFYLPIRYNLANEEASEIIAP